MSDTKWRTVFEALHNSDIEILRVLMKSLLNNSEFQTRLPEPYDPDVFGHVTYGLVETTYGPVPLVELEWVEFPAEVVFYPDDPSPKRVQQNLDAIEQVITNIGKRVPLERTASGLRIIGHIR
jgi:hypothetical protein